MQATRRTVLKGLAAGAAAVTAAGGASVFPRRPAAAAPLSRPGGTTLDSTVQRGPAINDLGYRRLVSGPAEPHVVRDDLGTTAMPGREGRRRAVLAFAHLTDIHVIDAQSPARVEYLDRYDDDERFATLFSSAYRPQEFLCTQLADGIIGRVRDVGVGPVTGARLGFAVCTGDNTDNQQLNELDMHLRLMNGQSLTPNSGAAQFEGVHDQAAQFYDVHYWHPDGTPEGEVDDNLRRLHGFPTLQGLLAVAIAQFTPNGVGIPWLSCYGNHDGLVQGNFPSTFQLQRVAVGPAKVVQLPPGVSIDDITRGDPAAAAGLLGSPTAPVRPVTADPARRIISRRESVAEHFRDGGLPVGHGFTAENLEKGTAYYVFDDPAVPVRGIVLDSVNPNGESSGSLDRQQFAWLRARLEEVTGAGRDRLVVVYSHHSIDSMNNRFPVGSEDPEDFGPRVLGDEVAALLLEFPNVVLWVNGHTHRNQVFARTRDGGGGFWEVNTAAHIDFPCQARLMELVDNRDGTLSIFATVIDADAPLTRPSSVSAATPVRDLTALARELAANDPQDEGVDRSGELEDRNVELLVAAPFALQPRSAPVPAQQGQPSAGPSAAGPVTAPRPATATLPATGAATATAAAGLGLAAAAAVGRRAARAHGAGSDEG